MHVILWTILLFCAVAPLAVLVAVHLIRFLFFRRYTEPGKCTVAFFHPYCNAGGGGERVLWCAIRSLASIIDRRHLRVVVYSGDEGVSPEDILGRVQSHFGIELPDLDVRFEFIASRPLLEAQRYPRFTMLAQSIASIAVAWECLRRYRPDVFIDTTGYAFTYLVAKLLAGCSVATYTHYPTITAEMLSRVHDRRPTYNNDAAIASSASATWAKIIFVGGLADCVMVNSSWTKGHIDSIWRLPASSSGGAVARSKPAPAGSGALRTPLRSRSLDSGSAGGTLTPRTDTPLPEPAATVQIVTGLVPAILRALGISGVKPAARIVYPPCNTSSLQALPLNSRAAPRRRMVVSVSQFRPEKDHPLQLRSMAEFRKRGEQFADVRFVMIGGCRDAGDLARVEELRALVKQLGLGDCTEFRINVPLAELKAALGQATAGLHTMWNEHFGISVVEMMAAGVIAIAHNSGGPRADIVIPYEGRPTGLLATTPTEYAEALTKVFDKEHAADGAIDIRAMAADARASVARFSDTEFELGFFASIIGLVRHAQHAAAARRAEEVG